MPLCRDLMMHFSNKGILGGGKYIQLREKACLTYQS